MRPRWRVTSLATALTIVSALAASDASAQQTGGEITVDPTGTFDRQGQATISGSYLCEAPEGASTFISGNLTQPVGRLAPVRGEFILAEAPCTGEVETWSATVQGGGQFRGGRAIASAAVFVCPEGQSCVAVAETTESLRLGG